MARPKITLYIDIISPFAYLAFHILRNDAAFQQCDITYIPVLLGGIMQAVGNTPPINVKNKDKWMVLERERWAKYFAVPISATLPQPFPQSTVATQRALCAVQAALPAAQLEAAADALFRAFWIDTRTIGKPDVIAAALAPVLGEAATEKVLAATKSEEIKGALKRNSEEAVEAGCFGLPYFICTNGEGKTEAFWGVDHLGQVVEFLGLERSKSAGFRAVL